MTYTKRLKTLKHYPNSATLPLPKGKIYKEVLKNENKRKYRCFQKILSKRIYILWWWKDITFNIVGIDFEKQLIEIAVTKLGRISVIEYDLKQDRNGDFYFTYGVDRNEISINDFETIND